MHDLRDELLNLDIEGLSKLLRDQDYFMQFHKDTKNILKLYSNKIFKVTNRELKKLKESYLIELAKGKIKVRKHFSSNVFRTTKVNGAKIKWDLWKIFYLKRIKLNKL